jgi:hypothetical protein
VTKRRSEAAELLGDPSGWTPVIFDESGDDDRARAEELAATAGVDVVDAVERQRAELAELRPAPDRDLLDEAPRSVYYPWRRTLVRLVGPRSFRRLRLDRNRNKITAVDQDRLAGVRIGVVGLSVGHVIAHTLALEGLCGELRLADFDDLELSNLNRIPATVLDLGTNKALVAARRIAELDPYVRVEVFTSGLNEQTMADFLDGLDVLIDECDSLDVKLAAREAARDLHIPVLMETSDRGLLDVERFDLDPSAPILHGLLGDLRAADLVGLPTRDKVPHVLRILEPDRLSTPLAASMAEIGRTLTTWPQLGGDVVLGAATMAAAVRRLALGEPLPSGRVRVDLDAMLEQVGAPERSHALDLVALEAEPREPSAPGAAGGKGHDVALDAPASTTDPGIVALVRAATLAPSGGNVQPWRFEADGDGVRIFAVPERSSTMDVGQRGTYVAIGAAAFNARVAASAQGRLARVEALDDPAEPDLVARVRLTDGVDVDLLELFPLLGERTTNRRPGRPAPITAETGAALARDVEREGGVLHLLTGDVLHTCADLLAESDRLRYLSPGLHGEMMRELRWPGCDDLTIGIDIRTLELEPADLASLAVIRRPDVVEQLSAWDAGHALGDPTRDLVRSSSAVAVVSVAGGDRAAFVRGGEALQRLWLRAQQQGLAVHPVAPTFVYAHERSELEQLVGARAKQLEELSAQFRSLAGLDDRESLVLVLRLSHAPPPSVRSERLPLAAVLTDPRPALTR